MAASYEEKVFELSKAIDIAIDVIRKYPPKGFDENHLSQFINSYLDFKNYVIKPEPEFANLKSLKFVENDVFTYFQESSGDAVNIFWNKIKENHLPFKRANKLIKILKRNKIKNKHEYDFIIDVMVPYQEEGLLNKEDVDQLNQLIKKFEKR